MSGTDFGGIMRLKTSTGLILSMRGTFNLMPSAFSKEVVTNQDGSVDSVSTPTAPRAEINFKDQGGEAETLLSADRQDVTITEEKTGIQHLFRNAFFSGEPQVNRINGETTGIQIVGSFYRRLS